MTIDRISLFDSQTAIRYSSVVLVSATFTDDNDCGVVICCLPAELNQSPLKSPHPYN